MKDNILLPLVILTAFFCGIVYGYGAAMLTVRRRSVNKPDPYLQMEYRHAIEQMAAPPPEALDFGQIAEELRKVDHA
jgi:hypothetical protein